MGYYYSDALGLIEREGNGAETVDEAYADYYLTELAVALHEKIGAEQKLKDAIKKIDKLNKKFGHLKEKYPEYFV